MQTVPHVLSPADSAQAHIFADHIHTSAEPLNRQVVSLYGRNLSEGGRPSLTLRLDASYIIWHFPGVYDYLNAFVDDDLRITAFEDAVAQQVYVLSLHPTHAVLSFEVQHESS